MTMHAQIAEWAWPVPPAATAEAAAADPTEARLRAVVLDILHPMSLVDDNYDMESAWVAVSTQAFERAAEVTQLAAQLPAPHLPQVLLLELVMAGALPDVRRDLRRAFAVNQAVEAGMINAARMQHGARGAEELLARPPEERQAALRQLVGYPGLHPKLAVWVVDHQSFYAAVLGALWLESDAARRFMAGKALECAMAGARHMAAWAPQSLSTSILPPEERVSVAELQQAHDGLLARLAAPLEAE